jgi:RNA polymerase sigma-70 factor (ECF subfamily)
MRQLKDVGVTPEAEFERLYREEGDRLWWAVLAFAGDREVANDAVAEAFAQALRRGSDLRNPSAWVWRATFRIAAGELQRRRRSVPLEETSSEFPVEVGELVEALAKLSPRQRAAVILHHYAGYPVKDVAVILGSNATTVSVHLHRARRRLRELMGADDE